MTTHYLGLKNSDSPELAGADFTEDVDFSGKYSLNLQNVPDLMSKESFWFDGVDDYVSLGESDNLNIIGDISLIIDISPNNLSGTLFTKWKSTTAEREYGFVIASGHPLLALSIDGVVFENEVSTLNISLYENSLLGFVYIAKDSSVDFYLNGKYSDQKIFDTVTSVYKSTNNAIIGKTEAGSITGSLLSGMIKKLLFFNLALTTDEIKALSNGAEVPYKYVGASQTELVTPIENRDFSGVNNWTNVDMDAFNNTSDLTVSSTAPVQCCRLAASYAPMELGKVYRISVTASALSGDTFSLRPYDGATVIIINLVDGINTIDYTSVVDDGGFRIRANGTGSITLDDFTMVQIGCVLNLSPSGMGHNQWIDSSGNNLHGTVSDPGNGPIPINLPTNHVEKFIKSSISATQTFTLPAGYTITTIVAKNTIASALTGDLDVGLAAGTSQEIVNSEAIGASETINCTLIQSACLQSTTADTTITISSSDWGSAVLDIYVVMKRSIA